MSVLYSPFGNQQFFDESGNPATGWKIYTYAAGSSTPLATYTTASGGVSQANPIILNALGFVDNPIWLTSGLSYKMVLTNAADVVKGPPEDNITGIPGAASVSQWQASGITPTYVSTTSFTMPGDQTSEFQLGRRLQFSTSGGTVYGSIASAAYGVLTTVTMNMDAGQVLDSGLSQVNYGLLSATNSSIPSNYLSPAVRQTVISGPVTTAGLSSFGGSTGGTTVTATGALVLTAANGFSGASANRIGQITNPAFTGLSTNGTMYLYLDISAGGVCTPGTGTLAPTYRPGGADVTTNGQFTFNWVEMVGKVGNGSAAVQTYRVYVGEVTVAGNVVTAITWYTMGDRFQTADAACTTTATQTTFTHNFGLPDIEAVIYLRCVTGQANIVAGQVVSPAMTNNGTAYTSLQAAQISRNQFTVTTGSSTAYVAWDRLTGNISTLTSANFTQFAIAKRPW